MALTPEYSFDTPDSTDLISDWTTGFSNTFTSVENALLNKTLPQNTFKDGKIVGACAYSRGAATSADIRQNELSALPIYIDRTCTVTNLYIRVIVAAANTTYRLGIYNTTTAVFNFGDAPGSNLLDAGTVDGSTTGVKNISGLSTTLTAGNVYWLAVARQGTSTGTTQRIAGIASNTAVDSSMFYQGGSALLSPYLALSSAFDGNPSGYYPYERAPFATGVTGALPTFVVASWNATNLPLVLMRVS